MEIKVGQSVAVYPNFEIKYTVIALHKKQHKGYDYLAVELSDGNTYAPNRIVI